MQGRLPRNPKTGSQNPWRETNNREQQVQTHFTDEENEAQREYRAQCWPVTGQVTEQGHQSPFPAPRSSFPRAVRTKKGAGITLHQMKSGNQ